MLHQGLRAVVPRPDRHAVLVEDLGDIVGMRALKAERQDGSLPGRLAMHLQAIDAAQRLTRARIKGMLVGGDFGSLEPAPEASLMRRAQADGLEDRRRAGLEPVRGGSP
jgi:hypothetical protein